MTKKSRRKFSAEYKTKVVLEALKEQSTIEELARKHELHPNQISAWKKEFLDNASVVFKTDNRKDNKEHSEAETEKLFSIIGQLKVENEWMKKKLK